VPPTRRSAAIALALVIPAPSIGALVSFWIAPGPIGLYVYGICKAVLYLTPVFWSRLVDREPLSLSPARRGGFGIGIASGLVISALIWCTWWVLGDRAIDIGAFKSVLEQNGLTTPAKYLFAAAWLTIVNAMLEEYAFRWFITTRLEVLVQRQAVWWAGAVFAAHHLIVLLKYLPAPTAVLATAGIFVGGVFWSWLYRRSGSIWPAYVSHAIIDAAVMAIGWISLF